VALAEIWKNSYKTKLIDWSLWTVPNSPMCSCRKVGRSPESRTRRRQRREERKRVKFCTMWQCLSEIKDDLCDKSERQSGRTTGATWPDAGKTWNQLMLRNSPAPFSVQWLLVLVVFLP
jgi:hypothetical protein